MLEANTCSATLGLSDDELAFYNALAANDSAVQVLGDEKLRDIARELVETVGNVTAASASSRSTTASCAAPTPKRCSDWPTA